MKYSDIKILPGVSVRLTLLALLFLGRLLLSFYGFVAVSNSSESYHINVNGKSLIF